MSSYQFINLLYEFWRYPTYLYGFVVRDMCKLQFLKKKNWEFKLYLEK